MKRHSDRRHHTCDRHEAGTAFCYYSEGCRCYGCSFAGSEYARRKRSVDSLKVPYDQVAPTFTALRSRGWSYRQLHTATGIATSTLVRINQRAGDGVYRHVAVALEQLLDAVAAPTRTLDAAPLVDAVAATGRPITQLLPDTSDSRAFYRARSTGQITDTAADRLCVKALGEPLELIYGTDYERRHAIDQAVPA